MGRRGANFMGITITRWHGSNAVGTLAATMRQNVRGTAREREVDRLSIRLIETEISKAKTAPGFSGEVDDVLYQQVIASYVKKMDDARQEYEGLGERGAEMVDKLGFEIEYLSRWLLKKLDEARTRELVQRVIAELGVSDPKAVGRVMGQVMKQHKDEVDGALVKRLVGELLGG